MRDGQVLGDEVQTKFRFRFICTTTLKYAVLLPSKMYISTVTLRFTGRQDEAKHAHGTTRQSTYATQNGDYAGDHSNFDCINMSIKNLKILIVKNRKKLEM